MSLSRNELYEFDGFRVNADKRLLFKSGLVVPLKPKTFEVLLNLVERRGEIVPYRELIDSVWGRGASVTQENLREQIALLRKALGDDLAKHRFIVNIPSQGYVFVAEVRVLDANNLLIGIVAPQGTVEREAAEPTSTVTPSHQLPVAHPQPTVELGAGRNPTPEGPGRSRSRIRVLVAFLVAITLLIVVALYALRAPVPLVEKQLTTNSESDPVTATAISPDGKYLAYADRGGINIQEIETSVKVRVAAEGLSEITGLAWFRDGSDLLVTGKDHQTKRSDLWELPFFTRVLRKLKEDVSRAAASPDGKRIAFVDDSGRQVGIMSANGDDPQIVFLGNEGDTIREVTWSPDGKRILVGRLHLGGFNAQAMIESIDQDGSLTTVLQSDSRLRASCVTPEGHIIWAAAEPAPHQNDVTLWESERVDLTKGSASRPRRIGTWKDTNIYDLSIASEGSRLVLLKGSYQADVYLGDLQSPGVLRRETRRLTLDMRNDLPTAWTSDSATVIFHSDRSGKWDIYGQRVDDTEAQLLVSGANDYRGARISPDGRWLLYFERPRGHQLLEWASPGKLISMNLASGLRRTLFEARAIFSFRCARAPSQLCVLGERTWGKFTFYALDPERGVGPALSSVSTDAPLDQNYWDLSPNGKQIAIVVQDARGGSIRTLTANGGQFVDVTIEGPSGFQSIDWSADGEGWYISRSSARGADILFVDKQGRTKIVREQPRSFQTWAVPSPDGKRLAILEWSATTNVWLVDRPRP